MPDVPRELVEHTLNVDPKARPVKQPLRRVDETKRKAIASELHHLENAGFIKEIKISSWVSNPIIVLKKTLMYDAFVLTIQLSTSIAPRIHFHYPE
jgi:hypothetical protein